MKRRFLQFLFFLISFNSYSQNFEWAKAFNGKLSRGYSIAVDPSGNVYSGGFFQDTVDFDPGSGSYNLSSTGDAYGYISKLDEFGNFVWAKKFSGGSNSQCEVHSITIDILNNIYITGWFSDTVDFDPGLDTFNLNSHWEYNMFITKLDSSGNFLWAKGFGQLDYDTIPKEVIGNYLLLDSSGNIFITGAFSGKIDFNPGIGIDSLVSLGSSVTEFDIFILKLNSNGNFVWAERMGGTDNDVGLSIAIDPSGNIYSTGGFNGIADFGIFTLNSTGTGSNGDIYISKLDSSGNFIWAKSIGGIGAEYGKSIAVSNLEEVYITGYFGQTVDFDPGLGTYLLSSPVSDNIFISKLDAAGNFVWAKNIGGIYDDYGEALTLDAYGNIYTTGFFADTVDFDSGVGVCNLNASGGQAIFISKLDPSGNLFWAISMGGLGALGAGLSIAIDAHGNIYTTGAFTDTIDFDPGTGVYFLNNPDPNSTYGNAFVEKLDDNFVSINEIKKVAQIKVYPNPCTNCFIEGIKNEEEITITDILGRIVNIQVVKCSKGIYLNLPESNSGIYFLRNNKTGEVAKFVKD